MRIRTMHAAAKLAYDDDTASGSQTGRAGLRVASPDRPNELDFALVTTRAAFDALEDDWNALFQRAASSAQAFQGFTVLWHWANNYLNGEAASAAPRLHILTAHRNGRLVMVWPLVTVRQFGARVLTWMGDPIAQYGDVLVEDGPDRLTLLQQGWDWLTVHSRADLMHLRRVRADAAVAPLLARSGAGISDKRIAPYLDLGQANDYDGYEQRYTSKRRRNRKRLLKRLEEQGEVTVERHTNSAEARDYAKLAIDLKADWLVARGLMSPAYSDPSFRAFFADAAEGRGKDAGCSVTVLKVNGEAAALDITFDCKGRALLHVLVYSLKFETANTGILLLEQLFRRAYARNIATYDMLAPGDAYKLEWSDATVGVADWTKPLTLKGHLHTALVVKQIRSRLKQGLMSLPAPVRRALSQLTLKTVRRASTDASTGTGTG
jgi:CelD/BcsL family acetyltransferase involved in cellulose biosynthesis